LYIKVDKRNGIPRNDTIPRSVVTVYITRKALTNGNTPLRYIQGVSKRPLQL